MTKVERMKALTSKLVKSQWHDIHLSAQTKVAPFRITKLRAGTLSPDLISDDELTAIETFFLTE